MHLSALFSHAIRAHTYLCTLRSSVCARTVSYDLPPHLFSQMLTEMKLSYTILHFTEIYFTPRLPLFPTSFSVIFLLSQFYFSLSPPPHTHSTCRGSLAVVISHEPVGEIVYMYILFWAMYLISFSACGSTDDLKSMWHDYYYCWLAGCLWKSVLLLSLYLLYLFDFSSVPCCVIVYSFITINFIYTSRSQAGWSRLFARATVVPGRLILCCCRSSLDWLISDVSTFRHQHRSLESSAFQKGLVLTIDTHFAKSLVFWS